ncbi:MAG: hypothetical protein AB1779_04145 [Candidatus Thermoplasmatota archaeon]
MYKIAKKLIIFLTFLILTPTVTPDWTMFRYNAQHTASPNTFCPSTNKLLWTYKTGDGIVSSQTLALCFIIVLLVASRKFLRILKITKLF